MSGKFTFGQRVEIVSGKYRGSTGVVHDHRRAVLVDVRGHRLSWLLVESVAPQKDTPR